jgi:hypothetical protein
MIKVTFHNESHLIISEATYWYWGGNSSSVPARFGMKFKKMVTQKRFLRKPIQITIEEEQVLMFIEATTIQSIEFVRAPKVAAIADGSIAAGTMVDIVE